MENFLEFFSFSDPSIRSVVLGSILLSASSAIVGSFTFLKKKALVGDAIAHAVLPGICLAFILSGSKNPLFLIPGALFTGWLSLIIIDKISNNSKIKQDTSIALILAVFFGFGILLLTMIQKGGNSSQTGLDQFLFGKAASLVGNDLAVFAVIALVLILAVFFLFKEFTLLAFDPQFGKVIGLPVKTLEFTLTSLTVLAVVVGIQSVGVVLMAAMLITPAAAARFWTNNIRVMVLLAATFGAVSGIIGAYISYIAPSMPTGPWIVVSISTIAFISFFFAPQKGIIFRMNIQVQLRKKINDENILKAFYHIGEYEESFFTPRTPEQLINKREFESIALQKGLSRLKSQGFLKKSKEGWILTEEGKNKGRRIVKLHRLWELYLTKYMSIAPDHVHDDAETIEHIITPEIEAQLEQLLEYPEKDPHESEIPY